MLKRIMKQKSTAKEKGTEIKNNWILNKGWTK
jgi:hypothetical protein